MLKICMMILAVFALQAHAKDDRNLAVAQVNNAVSDKRVALVIGNSAYVTSPLKNPVNDARDMANKLRGLGFEVIERNNLLTKQIGGTLREFRSKLVPGAVALVFYAGHGLQIKGDNYLPAVDAEISTEEDVPSQSLGVNQIMEVLDESKTRLNLVFLDACRNNPYARSFRSTERGLARVAAPSGTLISYATKPGSVAVDGEGNNGLYTSKLLTQMDSNQQIEQTLKQVVTAVKAASQGKQEPWMEGSIEGDFCFSGCTTGGGTHVASLVPAPAHVKSKDEIEQDTWESVKDSGNIDAVNEYLKQYPKGRFTGQARVLIATLKKSSVKPAEPVATPVAAVREDNELALWTEAQKGNSKDDYEAYISQYPNGKYIALAKSRIKKQHDEVTSEAARKELEVWESANQSGEEGYHSYLKNYPQGSYAGLAQVRLAKLQADQVAARQKKQEEEAARQKTQEEEAARQKKQEEEAAAQQAALAAKAEKELWDKAVISNEKAAIEGYLSRYPSGRYVAAASAKLKAIEEEEVKGPEMVRIPGKNYEIGKYEITQREWRVVMGSNPSKFNSCGDTCPVEQVSWDDIQIFLKKLNAKTGSQYRLPTEAEWEYACYGGSKTEYCGGNDLDALGWYEKNSGNKEHPVGQKKANGYGLYDMTGNVWEWMENKFDNEHDSRALRGGSWYYFADFARAEYRLDNAPGERINNYGFRVARTLP